MSEEQAAPAIESAMTIVPLRYARASIAFYADVLSFNTRFLAENQNFAMIMREHHVERPLRPPAVFDREV